MDNNYSLTDLAAVTNGGGMFGGGGNWFVIIILLFLMMGGNWGRNAGDYGQYATAASQQDILFSSKFQALDNKIDRIGNGIADATYALNNAVVGEGRGIQTQVGQVRYDMATAAASINANIDNKFAALEKAQLQQTITAQQNQINALNLAQQLCGVVRYPNVMAYNAGTSPFCGGGCCCN